MKIEPTGQVSAEAFAELERSVYAALETYSNVHRGSGHNSLVTTHLYEHSRKVVLEYLGLNRRRYTVVFCTPARAAALEAQLKSGSYHIVSSSDIGLPLGVTALAVLKKSLPRGTPFQAGGGTTRLVSREWVIWASAPDRLEAGTPAIINVIAFARALQLVHRFGKNVFREISPEILTGRDILYNDALKQYPGKELLDALRQTLIGRDVQVPTAEGLKQYINLDNSASTRTFTPVWEAVCRTWRQPEKVRQEITEEARSLCSAMLGAPRDDYDVIFTTNTTEAISMAADSMSREPAGDTEPVMLITLLEHSSNDLPWRTASPHPPIRLSIDSEGFLDMNELETVLCAYNRDGQHGNQRITLVAVSGASNVLGVFNDLAEISRIVHSYGARLLVDAAQMAAHRTVAMAEWGIDYLALSAHKIYAPFGSGLLAVRKGLLRFTPDESELLRSSGEENTAGIAALGKAIVLLQRAGMDNIREEEEALTARALRGLKTIDGLQVYGVKEPESAGFARKGGVIVFALRGLMADRLAKALAEQGGIGTRFGCHCAHILIKHLVGVSPGLERFQRIIVTLIPTIKLPGLLRVSIGIENSEEDVDELIRVLRKIALKQGCSKESQAGDAEDRKHIIKSADVRKQIGDFVIAAEKRVFDPVDSMPAGDKVTAVVAG
ncbi:MAG TPA: aminotransferase class V-fold PLP-dependent enzyme [Bacteroidales bacterium]|nr:aminotransferase class V-fold PLP-dependent enzyme [Bacteroidales bacterium]